jgi:signal transduction histidine kinase
MSLSRARARAAAAGDTELRTTLDHAADDLRVAIGELRELARGIHPVLLQQEGVGPALHALAERAPLPIEVSAPPQRFPSTVEATAYFLAAEAVTNAARHSGATLVRIRVGADGADLVLTVSDDGVGGVDAQAAARGSGLTGMRDRAVALGGTLRVASAPGAGTTVTARLPCG